jgi:hypothetical protein
MITIQHLLQNHQLRTSEIIEGYIKRYGDLEDPKTIYAWNLFLLNNAKDVIADLSQSSIDVFHEATQTGLQLNRDDFNSIRGINLSAAARYQEELRLLYETIIRNEK